MPNEIYDFLKANDLTSKSEADFIKEYSTPEKVKELHTFMSENDLTSKTDAEFYDTYFSTQKKSPNETGGDSSTPVSKSSGKTTAEIVKSTPIGGLDVKDAQATVSVPKLAPVLSPKEKIAAQEKELQRTRNIAKQHVRESSVLLEENKRKAKELDAVYSNKTLPIEQRNAAAKQFNMLNEQNKNLAQDIQVNHEEYKSSFDQDAILQTEKVKLEQLRQQGLEEDYSNLLGGWESLEKASVNALSGMAAFMNTIGMSGDPEASVEENEQVQKEVRSNLDKINEWSNTLITQETPENFKKIFKGDFTPKKLAYIITQATAQTAPTVAAGLLGGGAGATVAGTGMMYTESYDVMKEAGLDDKAAGWAALGMSIPLGMLEAYGMSDVILALRNPAKQELKNLAKEVGKDMTEEELFQLGKNTMTGMIGNYMKALGKTAIKESLTEGEQALVTEGSKQLAEAYSGQDSNAQQTTWEYLKSLGTDVAEQMAYGLAGGTAFGTVGATAERFSKTGYEKAVELKDPDKMEDFVAALKSEVDKKILTPEQADQAIKNVQKIQEVDSKIPDTITNIGQRQKAASLIVERGEIEQAVEGKDEALVAPQKQRVEEINNELTKIATEKPVEEEPIKEEETEIAEPVITEKGENLKQVTEAAQKIEPPTSGAFKAVYDNLISGEEENVTEAIETVKSAYEDNPDMVVKNLGQELTDKIISYDSKNIEGVSGKERIGEESVKTEPVERPSEEEVEDSGMVQITPEEEVAAEEEHNAIEGEIKTFAQEKGIEISEDDLGDLATLKAANEDATTEEIVNAYIENREDIEKTIKEYGEETTKAPGEETEGVLTEDTGEGKTSPVVESKQVFEAIDEVNSLKEQLGKKKTPAAKRELTEKLKAAEAKVDKEGEQYKKAVEINTKFESILRQLVEKEEITTDCLK